MDKTCLKFENNGSVLHWNYRGYTEFPIDLIKYGEDITDIYLKDNKIDDVPRDLYKLRSLESLYLSGNDIRVLPKEIGLLKTLKCLDLSGNCLAVLPEEVGLVDNLKYLFLDDNQLEELPLSINRLKFLKCLSVCDNKLLWLPQKPFFNYYACEFHFWRNPRLNYLPYSLWLATMMNQKVRCNNIGCFDYNNQLKPDAHLNSNGFKIGKCDFLVTDHYITFPPSCELISVHASTLRPPPLRELCLRKLNENSALDNFYADFLPQTLATEMCRGPIMLCENSRCKMPLFTHGIVDFAMGKIRSLDETKDVILSIACCSKHCCVEWMESHISHEVRRFNWKQIK